MDAKGRMAIPAKVRDTLASICDGRLVVTAHTEERCLLVYPEPQWADLQPKIEALPILARGSAMRFLLTRLYDWLNCPPGALVRPHDPMDYFDRLRFHQGVSAASAYGFDGS